jgi:hypothetical protein
MNRQTLSGENVKDNSDLGYSVAVTTDRQCAGSTKEQF